MYFFYKIENAQLEISVDEDSFLEIVSNDFLGMINLFNTHELNSAEYKIVPMTKAEARWMIEAFCKLQKLDETIPQWLIYYLSQCFERLLDGEKPAKSLGLTNPPHRPKESYIAERNKEIYRDVVNLMGKGESLLNAALEISEHYHLHESNIQKIYSAVKQSITLKESFTDSHDEIGF